MNNDDTKLSGLYFPTLADLLGLNPPPPNAGHELTKEQQQLRDMYCAPTIH